MSKDFLDERAVPPLSSEPGDWRLSDSIKRSALLRTKLPAPCVTLASIIRSWTLSWSQWYTSLLRAFKTENSFLFIRRLKDDFSQGGNERHALKKVSRGPIQMRVGEFTKNELFICTHFLVVLMHDSQKKLGRKYWRKQRSSNCKNKENAHAQLNIKYWYRLIIKYCTNIFLAFLKINFKWSVDGYKDNLN